LPCLLLIFSQVASGFRGVGLGCRRGGRRLRTAVLTHTGAAGEEERMGMNARFHVSIIVASFMFAVPCSPALAEAPWSFIVTGDSRDGVNGVNTVILGELAGQIVSHSVDFVLFPGDLVTGSTDPAVLQSQLTTWRNTMQPVYDAGIGVYPVRGNHDEDSVLAWNNVFSGPYALPANGPAGEENLTYSVTHKSALILGLDQYVSPHRVNQTWIDDQLAATTSPHVFAFGHEPAFAAQHTDCLDDYPANRDAFWSSLEQAGARAYFAGHDHFYDHARVDGDGDPSNDIHQYIVGTAGAPLRDWSPPYNGVNSGMTLTQIYHEKQYGYLVGEVDGLDVTLTWMARVGTDTYAAGDVWSYMAVPEPAAICLLVLGAAAATRRARS